MCDKEHFDKLVKFIQGSLDKQTQDLKAHIDKELAEIRNELQEERDKRKQLEEEHKQLKQKCSALDKQLRKNNIVIFGIEVKKEERLLDITLEALNTDLNLNLTLADINNVYTIGKQIPKKPIIVKFVSFLTKIEVLKSSKKLKGTSISVSEDLNLEERKINKILMPHLIDARVKGQTAYIKNCKLYVGREVYTADQLLHADNDNCIEGDTEIDKDACQENHTEIHKTSDDSEINPLMKKRKIGVLSTNTQSSLRLNDKGSQAKYSTLKK